MKSVNVFLGAVFNFIFVGVVVSRNVTTCPPLNQPEGIDISCHKWKDNATQVDCLTGTEGAEAIVKGTTGIYKCGKTGEYATSKLVCICKGKWKGVKKFNEFASSCGTELLVVEYGDVDEKSQDDTTSTEGLNSTTEPSEDTQATNLPEDNAPTTVMPDDDGASTQPDDISATTVSDSFEETEDKSSQDNNITKIEQGELTGRFSDAQASPVEVKEFQNIALKIQNDYREQHTSQPLRLNATLNDIAQKKADESLSSGKLMSTPGRRPYAENLYKVTGFPSLKAEEAVEKAINSWYKSEQGYDFNHPKATGFSQIVWNATTELGVGVAHKDDVTVVACTYYPRGNVILSNGIEADKFYYFSKNVFPSNQTDPSKLFTTTTEKV